MRIPMHKPLLLFFLLGTLLLISACRKEEKDVKGCTDPDALNYDPGALKTDSASCEYPEKPSEELIWSEGKKGSYDGQKFRGVFNISACKGFLDTMTLNPNSTDPGPFSIIVERDSLGQFGFVAELTNNRDLSGFDDGEIRFEMLDPDSLRPDFTFKSFVHGKICNKNHVPCENVCSSRYANISTTNLNDSTMKKVSVPLPDLEEQSLEDVDHVLGIRGEVSTGSDTVLAIRDIRLVP